MDVNLLCFDQVHFTEKFPQWSSRILMICFILTWVFQIATLLIAGYFPWSRIEAPNFIHSFMTESKLWNVFGCVTNLQGGVWELVKGCGRLSFWAFGSNFPEFGFTCNLLSQVLATWWFQFHSHELLPKMSHAKSHPGGDQAQRCRVSHSAGSRWGRRPPSALQKWRMDWN